MDIKDFLDDFLLEAAENLDKLEEMTVGCIKQPELLSDIFRSFHTLKGSSSFMGFEKITRLSHACEDIVGVWRDRKEVPPGLVDFMLAATRRLREEVTSIKKSGVETDQPVDELLEAAKTGREGEFGVTAHAEEEPATEAEGVVRVNIARVEELMNRVSELVLLKNRLGLEMAERLSTRDEQLFQTFGQLELLVKDIQDRTLKLRMLPFSRLTRRFRTTVGELAHSLGKEVEFVVEGGDVELDRGIIERMYEPLVHLLRNSLDHGLESVEERLNAGKPATGLLRLAARQEGDRVVIGVEDDGRGIDMKSVKEKAYQLGLLPADREPSEQELLDAMFTEGFSTAKEVTEYSGRGVGLDVIKRMATGMSGSVSIRSQPGRGCTLELNLPLTLLIAPLTFLEVGGERFAVPTAVVQKVSEYGELTVIRQKGALFLELAGEYVPMLHIGRVLNLDFSEEGDILIVRLGNATVALVTDRVVENEESVVRPLPELFSSVPGFTGVTISPDGSPVLILDLAATLEHLRETYA